MNSNYPFVSTNAPFHKKQPGMTLGVWLSDQGCYLSLSYILHFLSLKSRSYWFLFTYYNHSDNESKINFKRQLHFSY